VNLDATALLEAARHAAARAAAFLRSQEGTQPTERWSAKGHNDFVTEVDREAERIIAAELTRAVPGSTVLGEELSPTPDDRRPTTDDAVRWIVDPLDGTTNFLHRYPQYAVSISAALGGELLAGVVHHVTPNAVFAATQGGGATLNGRAIRVSSVTEPAHALIGTGFPFKALELLPAYQRQFAAVMGATSGIRRAGSAALDLCDVACGRFDGFWELLLEPWDVAAGTLIVREAGGVVTNLGGETDVLRRGPIVAGNAKIHAWLLDIVNS
jgi:myo-inositol-1(or 4)-monophosphatase